MNERVRTHLLDGVASSAYDGHFDAQSAGSEPFCRIRFELLANYVRQAHEFAQAVRRLRASGTATARRACDATRQAALLARQAYHEHMDGHDC